MFLWLSPEAHRVDYLTPWRLPPPRPSTRNKHVFLTRAETLTLPMASANHRAG